MKEETKQLKKGDTFFIGKTELIILDDKPDIVTNPFSGEECVLCPEALAVYDYIKGAERLGKSFSKELQYFMKKWPSEYMVLLD